MANALRHALRAGTRPDADQIRLCAEVETAVEQRGGCQRVGIEFVLGEDFEFGTGFQNGARSRFVELQQLAVASPLSPGRMASVGPLRPDTD